MTQPPGPKKREPAPPPHISRGVGESKGHTFTRTQGPPYSAKLSRSILSDIQADKKKALSQAMTEKGKLTGFLLFLYYAVKIACGWKPPEQEGTELKPVEPKVTVKSEQIGVPVKEKKRGRQEEWQEKKSADSFDIFNFYQEITKERAQLDVSHNIEREYLNGILTDIDKEYGARVDRAFAEAEEKMSEEAHNARREIQQLISKQQTLTETLVKKVDTRQTARQELTRLKQREQLAPRELEEKKESLERVRKNKVDPLAKEIEGKGREIQLLETNFKRFQELHVKWEAIRVGQREKEGSRGWKRNPLTKEEEEEYQALKKKFEGQESPLRLTVLQQKREAIEKGERPREGEKSWQPTTEKDFLSEKETQEFIQLLKGPVTENQFREQIQALKKAKEKLQQKIEEATERHLNPLDKEVQLLMKEVQSLPEKIIRQDEELTKAQEEEEHFRKQLREVENKMHALKEKLQNEFRKEELKPFLREIGRAIAYREGIKQKRWTPRLALIPQDIKKRIEEELAALFPDIEIDVKSFLQPRDIQKKAHS